MICDIQPELPLTAPKESAGRARAGARADRVVRTIPERFADWKQTQGGRHCLQRLYVIIWGFHRAWKFQGAPKPSKRLVWETLRFKLNEVRQKLAAKGHELHKEQGFWLNDNMTALAFDHVAARRPEFAIFEDREHEQASTLDQDTAQAA